MLLACHLTNGGRTAGTSWTRSSSPRDRSTTTSPASYSSRRHGSTATAGASATRSRPPRSCSPSTAGPMTSGTCGRPSPPASTPGAACPTSCCWRGEERPARLPTSPAPATNKGTICWGTSRNLHRRRTTTSPHSSPNAAGTTPTPSANSMTRRSTMMIAEEPFSSTPVPSPHDIAARFVLGQVSARTPWWAAQWLTDGRDSEALRGEEVGRLGRFPRPECLEVTHPVRGSRCGVGGLDQADPGAAVYRLILAAVRRMGLPAYAGRHGHSAGAQPDRIVLRSGPRPPHDLQESTQPPLITRWSFSFPAGTTTRSRNQTGV